MPQPIPTVIESIVAGALAGPEIVRKPAHAVAGTWRSRLGSTMELTVHEDHHIHGTYATAVGVPEHDREFRVVGFAEADAVTFCVDFGSVGSVASWAGHHVSDDDGERLVTLWHLVQPVRDPHGEADVWKALMAGADEFHKVS